MISAAEFAREAIEVLEGHADGAGALGLKNRSLVFREAIAEIRDLAAKHGIELDGAETKGTA